MRGDETPPAAALPSDAPSTDKRRLVAVSGRELEGHSEDELAATAEGTAVFGRVTPEQKEDLVRALRDHRHYVAMIGDGVNDVIALKQANVAVGMQGGSQAARGVSDLILLKDSFKPLPYAFREGQRIINGMNDILRIFMVRIGYKASIILAITALGGFPFAPRQASLISFVTAGVPAVALAAWARPGPTPKMGLFRLLARFVLPTALLQLLMSVGVWLAHAVPAKNDYIAAHPGAGTNQLILYAYPPAQTALTLFASFCGILLILLAVPPSRLWGGGAVMRRDWRFTGLVVLMLAFVAGCLVVPLGRTLFELTALPAWQYLALFAAAVAWSMLCRLVWHSRILDRWLGTAEDPGNICAKRMKETAADEAEPVEASA
jgi:cation-transporting ATPase E